VLHVHLPPLPSFPASIEFFHRHHFTLPPFTPALSREFAPYKPDPASLLHIAQRWSVQPGELVMIGDSAKDDVSGLRWLPAGPAIHSVLSG
jgi:HAD superfamily hydrolase (TIGR01549 family)